MKINANAIGKLSAIASSVSRLYAAKPATSRAPSSPITKSSIKEPLSLRISLTNSLLSAPVIGPSNENTKNVVLFAKNN